ncbi:uncharacterized protein LOC110111686 isoform X2 [Dendrobium catenatum]|uniref:Putative mediator of RNA polymerase II transcription subunit 26c n=1 Tax=Dendrobium catenatum TaxID=906689 RepID=A0A2I0VT31_9ASPA|nr:uncharacterized protein LOC110111686 isoform X2 [Dendrobium catenatum]PKU66570.1 putative mediator of RNA polymerase II transcription subunit 26c [Dendrobium catenatum]
MHGRQGEERKRRQHMWSVPAPGTAAAVEKPAVILQPPSPAANLVQTSADSFLKDGRKIQVGDCALFQAGNAPPFIGIIRWFSTDKEAHLKLCVNWLYRPADVKLAKGILPEAAPNEVFYSFHKDVISAASLLHPCKVAFLRKGVDLPLGISSFVCRRVYDIANKCLWWLTDQDYINEHQEEVDQLLDKTRLEMHAAVQSGGRSPKRLNGPASAEQLKSGSDSVQNSGTSFSSQLKGKKRDRGDHVTDPNKRDRASKADDGDSTGCNFDNNMFKSEISKITDKGALTSTDGVEKLVQLMQVDNSKKIDLTCRVLLADVIAATDRVDCLNKFVQIRGVPVLDEWLQEAHKGKAGDRNSPKESDKAVEELLLALLRALDKLPVNLNALQTCNIGKSVNHLRSHKNVEIQKKARSLVDTWKKRVDAEMKTNDAKPVGSGQAMAWPVKQGFSEVSHVGNRRTGSGDLSLKSSITQQSTSKSLAGKSVHADTVKSTAVIVGSGKQQASSLSSGIINSKEVLSKVAVGSGISDLPQIVVKEEKSSSSSQSCSSDHGKTVGSSLKEDARSSTAGSVNANKTSGGSSRQRKSNNGFIASNISGGHKDSNASKSVLLVRNSTSEKLSQAGINYEKTTDASASDHGSNHRLIVRLPNPGRSPARSTSGGSLEDPSAGSRASSPGVPDKPERGDRKVNGRDDVVRTYTPADFNGESWQSNDVKEGLVACDEGDRSPAIIPNEEVRTADETLRAIEISRTACSSSGNDKGVNVSEPKMRNSFSSMNALIESCAKYSEATTPLSGGDDIGMNLLASVAAGEISKSDIVSPPPSPGGSPATEGPCSGINEAKSRFSAGDSGFRNLGPYDENTDFNSEKHGKNNIPLFPKDEIQEVGVNFPCDNIGATPVLEDRTQQNGLLPDIKEKREEDEHQNQDDRRIGGQVADVLTDCNSEVRSPTDQIKTSCSVHETIVEGSKFTSDSIRKSLPHGIDSEGSASCKNIDKLVIGDSSTAHPFEESVQVTATLTGQKPLSVNETETVVERKGVDGPASSLIDKLPCPENADSTKSKMIDSSDGRCQDQTERNGSTIPATSNKAYLASVSSTHGKPNGAETVGSGDRDQMPTVHREAEASAKISAADGERKEEVSADILSFATTTEQDAGAKLDFDLNEGILGDDVNQVEPISAAAPVYSPAIRISSFSSLSSSSPILNGSPAPITVAAPAKGSFMPPENLLKSKGELGWKGSAATSAFRPAEPRKVLEMPLNTSDVQSSDSTTTKQGRPPLEIDLNVPDDRSLEDVASQSSAQTTGSESGVISNRDLPAKAGGGLDLDLNRVDEGAENGQFLASTNHRLEVPLLPTKPAANGFPNGEVYMLRDFDLNNGPGIDDVVTEPLPRSQNMKNSNNIPFVPPIVGLRMNNAELGTGWFPAGNSYPAVTIPSFLSDREQTYPMVAAAGAQRILGTVTNAGSFGSDIYRGPVLPSSPAMAFSPAATAFSYAGFPFGSSFPLVSTSFSAGSTNYVDSSSGGPYFPPIPSPLVGAAGAVSSPYARPYMVSLPEGSAGGGSDGSRKWGRQCLDLNAGPGTADEVKDDRVSSTRQLHAASSQSFMDEQARLYQVAGAVLKRKEPDGGWEPERFTFKQQPSWQ